MRNLTIGLRRPVRKGLRIEKMSVIGEIAAGFLA